MQETFSARELARLTGLDRKTIAARLSTLSDSPTLEELVAAFIGVRAPDPEPGLYSIMQLHKLTGLDRNTVTARLENVPSLPGPKNSKRYQLADALPALIAGRDVTLDEVKLKKERIKAEREELSLNKDLEKYIAIDEVRGELQKIFKALHNRLAVQFWRDFATTLYKAKTAGELASIGQTAQDKTFSELRQNYKALL